MNKRHLIIRILIITLIIISCIWFITLAIKAFNEFNEWSRSLDSFKPEIISKYKDNKKAFLSIALYLQSENEDIAIDRVNKKDYKMYRYGGGLPEKYYTPKDKSTDKNIRQIFTDNFKSIEKDRGAIYFIYRYDVGGTQGIVYTDDPKNLVNHKDIIVENLESNWYYFYGG